MKREKIYIYIFLLLAICMGLSGCTNNKEEDITFNPEQQEWNKEQLDENLIADFDVDTNKISQANIYECNMEMMLVEQIKEIFFASDTSKAELTERYYDPEEPEFGYYYSLLTENGLEISSSYFGSIGKMQEADYYKNFLSCDDDAWNNGQIDKLGTGEELAFLNKSQIESEIRNGLKKLIPNLKVESMNFYTLSAQYLQELQDTELERLENEDDQSWYEREKRYERTWQEQDGAYYITVTMSIDGIAVNDTLRYRLSNGQTLEPYTITVIYNKEGCLYIELPIFWTESSKQSGDVITVAQALAELREDMTSVILTDEKLIDGAELEYVIIRPSASISIQILPVWIFNGSVTLENEKEEGENTYAVHEKIYVNAITGEVLH